MYPHHHSNQSTNQGAYHRSATSATKPYSQSLSPPLYGYEFDPRLQPSPNRLQRSARLHAGTPHSSHVRRSSNDSTSSMGPPSGISPRLRKVTPGRASPLPSLYRPTDRSLPSREVTADTISDAYLAFILYCNPHFPLNVKSDTLRNSFQSPPKSDNKDFEIFRLFELLTKLESKEIKTWGQLALDLGVEPPDIAKGQSVQKVQQYSVRLKRWMRAMHIDAFFEYLLGKKHSYFYEVPPPEDPYPVAGRDGVLAEDDLAIRALDPSFRPKRGRRRNSDVSRDDDAESEPLTKQARFNASEALPSAYPSSAMPLSGHPNAGFNDPWASAASAINPHGFGSWGTRSALPQSAVSPTAPVRWNVQANGQEIATPHPMTAQPTSMAAHIEAAFGMNEPRSAVTPSTRRRRKQGAVVSSAWPSINGPGAKPRGRPPASRNVQDGPFSTFPADPANEKSPENNNRPTTPDAVPAAEERAIPPPLPPALISRNSDGSARPGRLSLQVPRHTGGPVRLATPPPPKVLVNGETNDAERQTVPVAAPPVYLRTGTNHPRKINDLGDIQILERDIPGFAFEVLKRVLTSDFLRATLIGRPRLLGDEAKRLADVVLHRLGVPREDTDDSKDDIARLTAASWLGLGEKLQVPLGPATSHGKTITVTRFRTDAEGYEEVVSSFEDPSPDINEVYDITWKTVLGGCTASFELKNLTLGAQPPSYTHEDEDLHDVVLRKGVAAALELGSEAGDAAFKQHLRRAVDASREEDSTTTAAAPAGMDWRARALALESSVRLAQGELIRAKDRMVQAVLAAIL
nr:ars-binding protein 2 [Quercus suber]